MTEEQKKEMLNGIINNGEKWEGRCTKKLFCFNNYNTPCEDNHKWQPYKLGDEIHDDWEYRKVETWYVFKNVNFQYETLKNKVGRNIDKLVFEGTKEECEKWIEEHTKKTWLEETFPLGLIVGDLHMEGEKERKGATEVCKKILEEVKCKIAEKRKLGFTFVNIDAKELKEIIKELGIEV